MQRVWKGTEDAVQRCSKRRRKKRGVNVHQGTKKSELRVKKRAIEIKWRAESICTCTSMWVLGSVWTCSCGTRRLQTGWMTTVL